MTDEQTPDPQPTPPVADEDSGSGILDSAAIGTSTLEPAEAAVAQPSMPDAHGWFRGTGRRKTTVARVRLRPGDGNFKIDGRDVETYFSEMKERHAMWAPLETTGTLGKLDVFVNVYGGGPTGQSQAIRVALGRALRAYDPTLEDALRDAGFLTVDDRQVERKKYGRRKARRSFQFSKR